MANVLVKLIIMSITWGYDNDIWYMYIAQQKHKLKQPPNITTNVHTFIQTFKPQCPLSWTSGSLCEEAFA